MISRAPVDSILGPKPTLPYVAYRLKCGYLAATCGFHGTDRKVSELISTLNEKFGMNLNDVDKIWFEQQKQIVKDDETLRVVVLNNDRDQYRVVMEKRAEDSIIERHEANGQLFNALFEKPGFRETLMEYLATSYEEIREADAS
jgi:hypothetical protein